MKNDENNRKGTLSPLKAVSAWMPAVFIAIGLLMLGICIRNGFGMVSSNSRVVAVRGLSEREVNANKVTWPIVSKIVGNDLTQIYSQVSATDDAIVNFLKKNGITDKEFQVNAPKVQDMQADSYGSPALPIQCHHGGGGDIVAGSKDPGADEQTNGADAARNRNCGRRLQLSDSI